MVWGSAFVCVVRGLFLGAGFGAIPCPSVFSVVNSGGGGLSRFKIEAWNRHQILDPDQDGDLPLD